MGNHSTKLVEKPKNYEEHEYQGGLHIFNIEGNVEGMYMVAYILRSHQLEWKNIPSQPETDSQGSTPTQECHLSTLALFISQNVLPKKQKLLIF
jgi:hypothetical protein